MKRRRMSCVGLRVLQMTVVTGCMMGLLAGCSSRLHTTIVSGSEGQKVKLAQVEPEPVVVREVEEVTLQPIQASSIPSVPIFDIPVEEPARPAIRSTLPTEIFATSKTPEVPSSMLVPLEGESTPLAQEEPVVALLPSIEEPPIQQPAVGIPPIVVEPEMPALPRVRQDDGPSVSQETPIAIAPTPEVAALIPPAEEPAQAEMPSIPVPPAATEPIQMAKVMPQEAAEAEIITETLEKALSDIYFDYDRFSIREDAASLLKSNAELLKAEFAEKKIVIEGHCDERGTQSYNMVLGEARAKAVKAFLEDLGISSENLQVVSYGKDKPFCQEQTEECWQENRRGHFVIK